jgi:hypothetical protein
MQFSIGEHINRHCRFILQNLVNLSLIFIFSNTGYIRHSQLQIQVFIRITDEKQFRLQGSIDIDKGFNNFYRIRPIEIVTKHRSTLNLSNVVRLKKNFSLH